MNRDTPEYREAVERVKISYFTDTLGLNITGILHVGANDGYEMQWYRKMGIENLMGVEPLPSAADKFRESYPDIPLLQCALGYQPGISTLNITPGDGQGSSLLREVNKSYELTGEVSVPVLPGSFLFEKIDLPPMNCLVLDVQGYEFDALWGFGAHISRFLMLNVECSREPVYGGGAPASVVEYHLNRFGFKRMTPICDHDDVMFVATSMGV